MTKFELNQVDVRGDGRVILYHRPDVKVDPKWQCRISIDGSTGYKRFSTKTSNQNDAERIALDKYFELQNKVSKGGGLNGKTVRQAFEEWVLYLPTSQRDRSVQNIEKNTIEVVENSIVAFAKNKRLDELRTSDIQDMMAWRFSNKMYEKSFEKQGHSAPTSGKDVNRYSVSTLRSYRGAINQFFNYCRDREYITQDFNFDIPKDKPNPRPEFSLKDWQKLTNFMRTWVKEVLDYKGGKSYLSPRVYRERFYLQHYILILGNTGIRVGEARGLRWVDLDNVILPTGEERLLLSVDGKTGKRDTVANAGSERYFKRLFEFRLEELEVDTENFDRNEYIFCHKDGSSIGSYKSGYKSLLDKIDLRITKDGQKRTIYSLRHTYATMKINEVPIYQLALNMGTSVKMIEEYYSHAKSKDPKFAQSVTKGNQKGSSKVLPF